jgi:hypothetical protein
MRPAGVVQRFRALVADENARVRAHPELEFRIALDDFIVAAARQYYRDLPVPLAVEQFWTAFVGLGDPAQLRTHTDFEDRCVDALRRLHPLVDGFADRRPEADPLDVDDAIRAHLVSVPPSAVLGEYLPGSSFDLLCWNAANCLAEGIRPPYRAARPVVHAAYHRPADPYGLVAPLSALTERYEDHPDDRPAVAAEITAVLTHFLEVAPWPRA